MTKRAPLGALLLLIILAGSPGGAAEPVVTDVLVRGNLRVERELVLSKIRTRAGEPYNPAQVREDIRAVYALGSFQDVSVELDDQGRVTFVLSERPSLREWRTEGAKEVPADEIEKVVPLKKREIVDQAKVEAGAKAIRELYREKGYYLAEVRTETVTVPDKNMMDVVYRVVEGEEVRVRDVHLLGVEKVDAEEVRDQLATRPAGAWSWLTGSGTFKQPDLERDREVVRAYYLNHGFIEVKVLDPLTSLTADRKWLKIELPVEEGESYAIGKISFRGDLEFPEERLREAAALEEGKTFRSDDFRRALQTLTDLYGDIGYAFADVDPGTNLDRSARTVSLEFRIRKGELAHIGRIEIRGNTKTRDRVVRREIRFAEGDLYNGSALRRSRQKIENLGYFDKVTLNTSRRPGTDLLDVDVEVTEKTTGAFSVGAGYSSVDHVVGMANVSQRNFLGLGYQLALAANLGSSRESYTFTFNNPRVFDSELYAGFDLFKSNREYTDYDKASTGGDLKIGRSFGEDWRIRTVYRWEDADVKNVDADASDLLKDQAGKTITSSIAQILTYDTRDNPWEPHKGTLSDASVEWAGGVLGGDAAFLKYDLEASRYVPLWWKHVLTLHMQIGYIQPLLGREIPVYERYYLGGMTSVRGFSSRSIGPREETATGEGDVIGGDKDVLFNLEYLFPLIEEAKVRGVLFFDAGNAWEEGDSYFASKLRTGAGFGVRWFSPMGPLRLEYGYNLQPEPGEERARWEFTIGGFF